MSKLQLKFLGEMKVIRDGAEQSLPPSKKTRALLAYLALNPKKISREKLSELLWEVPDDPRGALRWSLSKLRKIVDGSSEPILVADRSHIYLQQQDLDIDYCRLIELSQRADKANIQELTAASEELAGRFLEGLELDSFDEYYGWRMNCQQQVSDAQTIIVKALSHRLPAKKAIPYTRAWLVKSPAQLEGHLQLIRQLKLDNQPKEAEKQVELSHKTLLEYTQNERSKLVNELYKKVKPESVAPPPEQLHKSHPPVQEEKEQQKMALCKPLFGREEEVRQIIHLWHTVEEGASAQLLLLSGDAGIGKSTLVNAAIEKINAARPPFILYSEAFETEVIRPFAQWIDGFRKNGQVEVLDQTEGLSRDTMFRQLFTTISKKLEQSPVLIVFDDIHWCDESSIAAIHYILRLSIDKPLLFIVASREVEFGFNKPLVRLIKHLRRENVLSELRLGPLHQEDIQRIIASHAPSSNSLKLSTECAGNPLYAVEIAKAGKEFGDSNALTELIQEQFEQISPHAGEVLHWAAILETNISSEKLSNLTDLDAELLQDALQQLLSRKLLKLNDSGGFSFYHGLIRNSVYHLLPDYKRQVMHRAVAENLEIETARDLASAAELAHHAEKSGDVLMAARSMVCAGRLCLRFYATEDALKLAEKGLMLAESLPKAEKVCVTIELTEVKWKATPIQNWESEAEQIITLAEEALDYGSLAYARLGYQMASYLRWEKGQWQGAHQDSMIAEQLARSCSDMERINGLAQSARCLLLLEKELPKAEAILLEASSVATRKAITTPLLTLAQGMMRYYANDLTLAAELLQNARTGFKLSGDHHNEFQANEYLVMTCLASDQFESAEKYCNTLSTLGEKMSIGSEYAFAKTVNALCRFGQGNRTPDIEVCLESLRECDAKHRLAYTLTRIALIELKNKHYEKAIQCVEEALCYTKLLNRPSERFLALSVLIFARRQLEPESDVGKLQQEINGLQNSDIAGWARKQAPN